MERQGIPGCKHSTLAQWAAIQVYALTVEPIASNGMATCWEANTNRGRRFMECLDFLLKDVAKKHYKTLSAIGLAVPPTPPIAPAAVTTGNDRKSPQLVRSNLVQCILVAIQQVWLGLALSASGSTCRPPTVWVSRWQVGWTTSNGRPKGQSSGWS